MKAAIYCRLSDEDRDKRHPADESESIQNQKTMLLAYAFEQQWDVYGIYSDDDYTGADRNRPAFNALLEAAQAHKFEIVLCKTQSRFTRELEYVEKYLHTLFPIWGIRFVSVVDHADTALKSNKKARQINGLINEWYLEDLSDNIRSVLTTKRKSGLHIGSFSLYGYLKDPNLKGHLIVDNEAAAVVREVFLLFAQGYGKTNIARILNERGVPNPSEYKRIKGLLYQPPQTKTGSLWKYSAISKMLINEMYIGNMVQGRYASASYKMKQNRQQPEENWIRVEHTHEPIIDMELWMSVQELIQRKAKPFAAGSIGLFAGKARCMNCGGAMRSSKTRGSYYLRCPCRHISKEACVGSFLSVRLLEEAVRGELKQLTDSCLNIEEVRRGVRVQSDRDMLLSALQADIGALEKKKANCGAAMKQLYLDRALDLIGADEFSDLLMSLRKDLAQYNAMLGAANARCRALDADADESDVHILVQTHIAVACLTRELVDVMIECIYIGKKDPETNEIPVKIRWHF